MGWQGYVPEDIYNKYINDQDMSEVVKTYGGLRKHDTCELEYLFSTIKTLKEKIKEVEMKVHRSSFVYYFLGAKINGEEMTSVDQRIKEIGEGVCP